LLTDMECSVVLETCQSQLRRESEEVLKFEEAAVGIEEDERAVSSELIQRLRTLALAIQKMIQDLKS